MGFLCHQCLIGRVSADRVPYLQQMEEGILLAPQVPALVCNYCDFVSYDPEVIQRITFLLQATPAESRKQVIRSPHLQIQNRPDHRKKRELS